jgi:hypothetical protein
MMIYATHKKRKPKLKPKKEREEYQAWLTKHGATGKRQKKTFTPLEYKLEVPAGRTSSRDFPSRGNGIGTATLKDKSVYTGDKMMGIGTLHKSNAVPVFSQEEAQEMSKMRR